MNVSLVGCLARPARRAATKSALLRLPARSVTRVQRGSPLIQSSPLLRTLGSSRSFSWNPFGGSGKSQIATQSMILSPGILNSSSKLFCYFSAPVPEALASPQPISEENLSSSTPVASQSSTDSSALTQAEVSAPTDISSTDVFSDTLSDAALQIATSPAPTKYGDMEALGLVSWAPAGLAPWVLESVQVSTGLPWWQVIMLTTMGARMALVPLVISAQEMQGRIAPLQPKLTELRDRAMKARAEGDLFGMRQATQQQQLLLSKHDVSPFKQIVMSLGQVAVQLGLFLGIRRMCLAPVEQLKVGGIAWFMDLTVADPYYILPIVSFALVNLQMSLSRRDMLATGSPNALHVLNIMRFVTIVGIPVMAFLPAALNLNIIASVAFISAQTAILRIPALRQRLSLPKLPPITGQKMPTMKDTYNFIKDWYRRKVADGQRKVEERERKLRMAQRRQPRL
ncbi:hypothetical protein ACEPAI_2119 [Sanghuangporus weigelae]